MTRQRTLAALGFALVLLLGTLDGPASADEPTYRGKPLSVWVAALKDEDGLTRIEAARAVAHFGPKAKGAVPALVSIIKNRNDLAWHAAVEAAGAVGPAAAPAAPALTSLLEDEDASVRALAVTALGRLGHAGAVPATLNLLSDADREVQRAAKAALDGGLARTNPDAVFNALREGQINETQAADWLAGLGAADERSTHGLVKGLKDPDARVRAMAADGLRRIGGPAKWSLPNLEPLLEDKDEKVRASAKRARAELEKTTGSLERPKETPDKESIDQGTPSGRLPPSVLGTQNKTYRTRGYAGLTFGSTRQDVERVSPVVARHSDRPWLVLKNDTRVLFSPEGRLVGLGVTLPEGDVKHTLERLKAQFGSPQASNTERFTLTTRQTRQDVLRVTYHLAEVVAVVRVVYAAGASGPVTLDVFDRRWVVAELTRHLTLEREALRWFRGVVKAGKSGGFDKAKLPPHREARAVHHLTRGLDGVYWFAREDEPAVSAAEAPQRKSLPTSDWFASIGVVTEKSDEHAKGTVICALRLSRVPGRASGLLRTGAAFHLLERLRSILVQEAFGPQGDTITAVKRPTDTTRAYEWQTRDSLRVRVQPDETVAVVRRPE